jgi:precorrin-8X/cobalt-precorrin-8 methylmutase
MSLVKNIPPQEIEARSFSIIESEFQDRTGITIQSLNPLEFPIIRRVIHATGDFSFAETLVFLNDAVPAGIETILQGRDIFIDVSMGASGINKTILGSFGGQVICNINEETVARKARAAGRTRSETALRLIGDKQPGIIAVGNAPTALIAAMELIEKGELQPALVIGVPVGFVNAEESKELLVRRSYPSITNRGRKGGSPVAVAIINALLKLCQAHG